MIRRFVVPPFVSHIAIPNVYNKPATRPTVPLFERPLPPIPENDPMPSTSVGQRRAARKRILAKFAGKLASKQSKSGKPGGKK